MRPPTEFSEPGPPGAGRWEGDWDCAFCGALVFAGKPQCFKCRTPKPGGEMEGEGSLGVGVASAGDLACLAAHASTLAGHPGAAAASAAQMDTHHKGDPETRSKRGGRKERAREREEGDWDCASCGALVFAGRLQCFKCRAPMWDARAARQNQVMPGGEPALEEGGGRGGARARRRGLSWRRCGGRQWPQRSHGQQEEGI